jgi:peptidoglycan hydrolase-like protein with peptidoglycan-binding domain/lysophospholipase L1-like esterase
MRAREFLSNLFEAESTPGYVAVGDSHAHAVGQMGGKAWLNLAVGGASSKGTHPKIQQMLGNISQIPKGSVVLISLGANDTANAMVPGKPSRTASSIASDVAGVVDKVKARGPSKIVFLLFPNGPGRGSKDAQFYGGEFQDEVRNAIKVAVGGITVIDLNGKPLTDGVHAGMSTYKQVAQQVMGSSKPSVSAADPSSKDQTAKKESFVVNVPQGKRGPDIADAQKALEALGIPLPKYGVDGIQGKETTNAVKKFQATAGIEDSGILNQMTVDRLNSQLKAKPELLATLTKSTNADVKSIDYSRGAEEVAALTTDESTQKARAAAEKYLGRKMSDQEWNYLLRATAAEASNNSKEQAYVMGVILNRARDGHGKASANVISVLKAPSQFQAVTGTRFDPGPSSHFTRGPIPRQLANIVDGTINILPQVPNNLKYFTAASAAAYGRGTNIGFRDQLLAKGGEKIGGTIFAATA